MNRVLGLDTLGQVFVGGALIFQGLMLICALVLIFRHNPPRTIGWGLALFFSSIIALIPFAGMSAGAVLLMVGVLEEPRHRIPGTFG